MCGHFALETGVFWFNVKLLGKDASELNEKD